MFHWPHCQSTGKKGRYTLGVSEHHVRLVSHNSANVIYAEHWIPLVRSEKFRQMAFANGFIKRGQKNDGGAVWICGCLALAAPAAAAAALTEINYKYWTAAGLYMYVHVLVLSPKNIFRGRKEIIDCVWRPGYVYNHANDSPAMSFTFH